MTVAPDPEGRPGTSRRRANTRVRLLEAAEDVFVRKGLNGVTVDDLVGAAGFTRGAFYSNFTSIEEVFVAVFERQSVRLLEVVREVMDSIPEDEFTVGSIGLVLDALAPLGRRWFVIQTECTLLAMRSESARELLRLQRAGLEEELREAIGSAIRRLGRTPTSSIEQVTEAAVALYLHSLGQEGLGFGSIDPRQFVESVLPQVVLGLTREAD